MIHFYSARHHGCRGPCAGLLTSLAMLLAACGGGGGAADPAVSPAAPATAAANSLTPVLNHRYVAATGSDSNPGTQSAPFKTILKAAQIAAPGTTVHVAAGTYEGGFQTTVSGTVTARIAYLSDVKWGAKIVPPPTSANNTAWDNRGNYVDIDGFEIDGGTAQAGAAWLHGIYTAGSYGMIENNHVHHIASAVACTDTGGSGIGVDSYYSGVKVDVIANLVHDIGPAGCAFVQGIYISTSGSVQNNVVYRIAEAAIHLWHDATNVLIANNTVSSSGSGIIVGGGDFYHTAGPNDYTTVINNIVYDNKYGISEQGSTGSHNSYKNNLSFQNSTYNWSLQSGLPNTAGVSADPQFVSYSRSGTPNYHLLETSPAIGTGTAANAPALNMDGVGRASSFSMGAY